MLLVADTLCVLPVLWRTVLEKMRIVKNVMIAHQTVTTPGRK